MGGEGSAETAWQGLLDAAAPARRAVVGAAAVAVKLFQQNLVHHPLIVGCTVWEPQNIRNFAESGFFFLNYVLQERTILISTYARKKKNVSFLKKPFLVFVLIIYVSGLKVLYQCILLT